MILLKVFGWIFKIILFPFTLVKWVVTAPTRRKRRRQQGLEKCCVELTKEQREAEEYFDKYNR